MADSQVELDQQGEPSQKRSRTNISEISDITPALCTPDDPTSSSTSRSLASIIEELSKYSGLENEKKAAVQRAEKAEKERDEARLMLAQKEAEIRGLNATLNLSYSTGRSLNDFVELLQCQASRNNLGNSLTQTLISLDKKESEKQTLQQKYNKLQSWLIDTLTENQKLETDKEALTNPISEITQKRDSLKMMLEKSEELVEKQKKVIKLKEDAAETETESFLNHWNRLH